MQEFSESLRSPSWWASVVVCGLLVNLAAAYTKPLVDRIPGSLWGLARWANSRIDSGFETEITYWSKQRMADVTLRIIKLEQLVQAILCFGFAILSWYVAGIAHATGAVEAAYGAWSLAVLFGLGTSASLGRHGHLHVVLREVNRRKAVAKV